jgi:quinol monooxygenase YgiN
MTFITDGPRFSATLPAIAQRTLPIASRHGARVDLPPQAGYCPGQGGSFDLHASFREGENMIHVVATIKLQADTREKFLRILRDNIPRVQAEQGCRAYAPAVDIESGIPVQAALRPDVVTIIEAWDSLEDLRVHLKAPHMLSYREKVQGLVKNVSIHVLTPA